MFSLAKSPILRGKYSEVKDVLLEYAFREGQVWL